MKIAFFSDAHGNQYSIREFFRKLNIGNNSEDNRDNKDNVVDSVDLLIFGGDIFGYYYGQNEILSTLRRQKKCICLLGNHDKYFLDLVDGKIEEDYLVERYGNSYRNIVTRTSDCDLNFLRSLKSRYDVYEDDLHLVFVHGSIDDSINGRVYPDTQIDDLAPYDGIDYVFMGHTHHKLFHQLRNGTFLINPGSIGQQRDGKGCTYAVFNTETEECKFLEVSYDKDMLVSDIYAHKEVEEMEQRLIEVLYMSAN